MENIDISGSSSPLFYIIQKNTNILLKDSNNNIQEKNYLESHIPLVSGSYNLLKVSNLLRELKGGYSGQGTNYIMLLYCLDILGTIEFSFNIGGSLQHEPQPELEPEPEPEPEPELSRT